LGIKFRRQHAIGDYILDFYSPECRLCIELDGNTHYADELSRCKDFLRDAFLKKNNIKVLRFLNTDIKEGLDGVMDKIKEAIKSPL
jgi:very-short-patch-repair endonuclease